MILALYFAMALADSRSCDYGYAYDSCCQYNYGYYGAYSPAYSYPYTTSYYPGCYGTSYYGSTRYYRPHHAGFGYRGYRPYSYPMTTYQRPTVAYYTPTYYTPTYYTPRTTTFYRPPMSSSPRYDIYGNRDFMDYRSSGFFQRPMRRADTYAQRRYGAGYRAGSGQSLFREALRQPNGQGETMAPRPTTVVTMTDQLRYRPAEVRIRAGETVEWRNTSSYLHTVTADPNKASDPSHVMLPNGAEPFDSGPIRSGDNYLHTFLTPGRYRYFCIPHADQGMIGEVVVEPPR